MAGLLDYITEAAKAQYAKGAPYRNALGGLLSGDMTALQELNQPSPVMPNEALDVAMTFAPMGITKAVGGKFPLTEFEVKQLTAQRNAALPVAEGGLGLPVNNTAMDRAKALGFDDKTYYHGTNADIKAFDPEKSAMGGITWIAETPKYANDFTTNSSLGSGNILPLKAKMGKTAGWKEYDQLGLDELTGRGYESTWLPEKNAESVGFVFNPNQLRSTNAAFDPFRRNEADILAGVGVGVPVASGLLDIENKKVPKKEKKKTK
jgi:hypothetical protein